MLHKCSNRNAVFSNIFLSGRVLESNRLGICLVSDGPPSLPIPERWGCAATCIMLYQIMLYEKTKKHTCTRTRTFFVESKNGHETDLEMSFWHMDDMNLHKKKRCESSQKSGLTWNLGKNIKNSDFSCKKNRRSTSTSMFFDYSFPSGNPEARSALQPGPL